jgi:hypothetical protein
VDATRTKNDDGALFVSVQTYAKTCSSESPRFLSSFLSSLLPSPCFHSDVKRGAMRQKKNGINRRVANCSISESHDSTIFYFFI